MRQHTPWISGLLLIGALTLTASQARAGTLEDVKARGALRCGVNGELPGLSYKDDKGAWSGLDVDFCRAVAAATLGKADKVELVPLNNSDRFDALREGEVDLLSRNTTWTLSRDLDLGMAFAGILYHDGQGFMVPRGTSILSVMELSRKRICAIEDSTSPTNAEAFFTRNRMQLELVLVKDANAAKAAYQAGKCDAITTDHSQLHALRAELGDPALNRILPEVISKEPLSPAVRQGDQVWFDIVRWTLFLLIDAEELGIDSTNVDGARALAKTAEVRGLLDVAGATAGMLGVEPGWSYRVIKQVGNYAEIFDRNLGDQSPLKIKRGLNALWRDGGILYAPPTR
jgi:general L-amino acid transport system substrate-binding protein